MGDANTGNASIGHRTPAPSAADGRRTLAVSCAEHFVHDGIADAIYVLLPVWALSFALDYAQVGTLRMAYSSAMAVLQMPAGMLGERTGERALLSAGTLLAAAGFALLATANAYVPLLALILLSGIGSAVQHPIASTLIARVYAGASRRAALGVYNFVGDVGKMVVTVLIGLAIAAMGWRASVAVYGAIVAAVGVFTFLALGAAARPILAKARGRTPLTWGDWGFTSTKGFALLAAIQVIDSACRTGFLTFAPFLLIAKGAGVASIGFALGLIFIGGAAGKLVCGLVADRFGILRTVILTELATGILIAAVVAAPPLLTTLLLIPLGIALNGTSSVLYGTVAEFVREDRQSRSFGLFYALGSAAGAIAPLVFGVVSDAIGVASAILFIAAFALLTLPIALALNPYIAGQRMPETRE